MTLPAACWLWRVRLLPMRAWGQVWRNAAMCVAALAVVVASVLVSSRELAPLMRNNVMLRYMINPLASVYSTGRAVLKPMFEHSRKLIPISAGAALGASYAAQAKPPLFLVVVGETARADHFALNGYGRDTTPELAARGVRAGATCTRAAPTRWPRCRACSRRWARRLREHGTTTRTWSTWLQAAGLAVLWIDNQPGGCKGVCDRVPHADAASAWTPP